MAGFGFLEADQEFAEAIEPGVGSFHNPPPCLMFRIGELFFSLLGARFQVQSVVLFATGDQHRISNVSGVYTEYFAGLFSWFGSRADDTLQGLFQQFGVMHVCSAGDER